MSFKRPTTPVILNPRAIASMPNESFQGSGLNGGHVTWKTLLSNPKTNTDTFTTGIATCPAKGGHLKCHRHKQTEIYHVLQGRGFVRIDGQEYGVEKGSVVWIPGDAEHGIWNTSEVEGEDLVWFYIFAVDGFEDVVYRFDEEKVKAKL